MTGRLLPATALAMAAPGALAWGIATSNGFDKGLDSALLLACAAAACSAVILTGPVVCLIAVSTLQIVGLVPVLMRAGRVDFTLVDVFYLGLVGWWSTQSALGREDRESRRRVEFGEKTVVLFLAYIGVMTVAVLLLEPARFATSAVSWIRLVQTASLAWLAASVLRSTRALRLFLSALAMAATTSIALALGKAILSGESLSGRYGGMLQPDALGLVSGLVIIFAFVGGGKISHRATLGVVGALGFGVSKSQGALIATAVVLVLALASDRGFSLARFGRSGTRAAVKRLNRGLFAGACAGVLIVAAVQFLRPESIPTSNEFRKSSVYQRLILGAAGVEIFSHHPFSGVGWRRSDSPAVIAAPDLAADLRRRFPTPNEAFYPDVENTSVHNTYLQVLAELGLIGAALLIAALWAVGRRVRGLLRTLKNGSEGMRQARFLSFGALLTLVWLNDNPLYGGQLETVLLAVLLGSLAALARLTRPDRRERAEQLPARRTWDLPTLRVAARVAKSPGKVERREFERSAAQIIAANDFVLPRTEAAAEGRPARRLDIAELEIQHLKELREIANKVHRIREKLHGDSPL